jgi:hypothetical protein
MPDISGFKQDVIGAYIDKDPAAQLTYTVDWTEWLLSGVTLSTSSFSASTISGDTAPLTIGTAVIIDNKRATAIISGGKAGEVYTVTNTITTSNGDTDRRRFRIRVLERYL